MLKVSLTVLKINTNQRLQLHVLNDIFLVDLRPCNIDCYPNNRLENETALL